MKRIYQLTFTVVLPITIVLFGTITKCTYAFIEDIGVETMVGFPLPAICRGWHTSMSLQLFVRNLLINFFVYFSVCLLVVLAIDRFVKKIKLSRIAKVILYTSTVFTILFYNFTLFNHNNIVSWKKDFSYKVIGTGYTFFWQNDLP